MNLKNLISYYTLANPLFPCNLKWILQIIYVFTADSEKKYHKKSQIEHQA